MKALFIFSSFSLALISCSSGPTSRDRQPASVEISQSYQEYTELAKKSEKWRTDAHALYLKITSSQNKFINAAQSEALQESARQFIDLRNSLFPLTQKAMFLFAKDAVTKFSLTLPSGDVFDPRDSKRIFTINPLDESGAQTLISLRISMAAALSLYDNYLIGVYPFTRDPRLSYKLQYDIKGKDLYRKIGESFFDYRQRQILAKAIHLYNEDFNWKQASKQRVSAEEIILDRELHESQFFNFMVKSGFSVNPETELWKFRMSQISDDVKFTTSAAVFFASKIFGNSVGMLKSEDRMGYMKNLSPQELDNIRTTLRPLDIMLEKTPFRATDTFIPGYYGHAAIWLGTEAELRELGAWDSIKPEYQKKIRDGFQVLEALRSGVQLSRLEDFMDIDDLLVIRSKKEFSRTQSLNYVRRALQQIGKAYDFNFDVSTENQIVCSELIYVIFNDIEWVTSKALGRYTISPDHVMMAAMPGKDFTPVILYKNATRKIGNLNKELQNIMAKEYHSIAIENDNIFKATTEPQQMTILTSGIGSIKKRLEMIEAAQTSIELEFFIYEVDSVGRLLTQALINKKRQNPNIRIRVLVDTSLTVFQLKPAYATIMRDNGIEVRYYNVAPPFDLAKANFRSHRKSFIIDDIEAITGGRNIGSDYFDLKQEYNFLDTDLLIKGTIAHAMREAFDAFWYSAMSEDPKFYNRPISSDKTLLRAYEKALRPAQDYIRTTDEDRRVLALINTYGSRSLRNEPTGVCTDTTFVADLPGAGQATRRVFPSILKLASEAQSSLKIESPYFVITPRGTEVFKQLLDRNVKLEVLTNSLESTDATYTVAALLPTVKTWTQRGVNLWIYRGENPLAVDEQVPESKNAIWGVHSKRAVIDDKSFVVGTYNVDPRSTDLNAEMIVICKNNPELAQSMLSDMNMRKKFSSRLGQDGLPVDGTKLTGTASEYKKAQYWLFERLTKIPFFRRQL